MKRLTTYGAISLNILIIGILSTCSNINTPRDQRSSAEVKRLVIDKEKAGILDFKELFNPPDFIPLETNQYSLVSNWNQVIITDSLIFFVPQSNQVPNGVLMFNSDGSFRNSIFKYGRGPDEYISLPFIYVDELLSQILFYDIMNYTFGWMDYSGEFVKKIKTPGLAGMNLFVHPRTGKILLDTSSGGVIKDSIYHPCQLAIFDPNLREYKVVREMAHDENWLSATGFSTFADNVYFKPTSWDTIYTIGEEDMVPKYILDFGKYSKPKAYFKDGHYEYIKLNNMTGLVHMNMFFKESDYDIVTIHRVYNEGRLFHHYDKETETSHVYDRFINAYVGQTDIIPLEKGVLPFFSYQDKLIFIYEPVKLIWDYHQLTMKLKPDELDIFKKENPKFVDLIKNLKESDNPVLALYSFRRDNK